MERKRQPFTDLKPRQFLQLPHGRDERYLVRMVPAAMAEWVLIRSSQAPVDMISRTKLTSGSQLFGNFIAHGVLDEISAVIVVGAGGRRRAVVIVV